MKNILFWILLIITVIAFPLINTFVIPNTNALSYCLGMTYTLVVMILFELKRK